MNNGNQNISSFFTTCGQAMEDFQKVQMDAAKQFSQLQLDFMNLCMECNAAQMQRLAKAETPSDIMATESGVMTEYMNKFFNNAQQSFDAFSKTQEQMLTWMQHNSMLFQLNGGTESRRTGSGGKKAASAS